MSNFLKLSTTTGVPTGTAMVLTDLPSIGSNTILGNNTGGSTTPLALTTAQVTAILNQFTNTLQGLVPGSGGGTTNFLRADGTWAAPSGSFTNPMTTLGDIIYENATPAPARLAGNTSATLAVLTQTGTGSVSAAPVWTTSTGTGSAVFSASPSLSGTITGVNLNLSGFSNWQELVDSTTTGSNAALNSASKSLVVVTNASLTSLSTIPAGQNGQLLILSNQTGASVTLNNQSGSPTANQITTGTAANLTLANSASIWLVYDNNTSKWLCVGGSGGSASPLTTKGDLYTYTTTNARHPVPADYGNIIADSQQSDGWRNRTYTMLAGRPGKNYIQYADFENNALTGWSWTNVGTLTNGLPTGTPNFTSVNSNPLYSFTISTSTTCAVGDTYTNNSQTFTVVTALSAQSGTVFFATGTGDPTASGTLTRATGSGTSSITFSAFTKETMSVASSGQLAGSYSLSVASSGATVAGLGIVSNSYAIDTEDQAKVMTVKFYYTPSSGAANCNFSGTSSNSFAWAIYDVTNSTWLSSQGNFNLVQSSGSGYVTGTCQMGASTANIRLCVYNANATSGAATLVIDDFYVGPQTAPSGPAMGDWISYTPTLSGFGTTSGLSAFYKRIGDSIFIIGNFTTGTVASSVASISLPSGLSIDSTKLTNNNTTSAAGNILGRAAQPVSPNYQNRYYNIVSATGTSTSVAYVSDNLGDSGGSFLQPVASASGAMSNTTAFTFEFYAPVTGWSSNTVMSADTDTRLTAAAYGLTTAYTPTSNTATKYDTQLYDTNAAYSTSTGLYTVPVSGKYRISVNGQISTGSTDFYLVKNGTAVGNLFSVTSGSASGSSGSMSVIVNAGDTLGIYQDSAHQFLGTGTQGYSNWFSIERLSGPAVVTATESVNARYFASSSSVTSSYANVVYSTKDFDSHNAYSSGTYTVPVTGKYQINAAVFVTGNANAEIHFTGIFVNGTQKSLSQYDSGGALQDAPQLISDILACNAGDLITIKVKSATATAITSSNFGNYFTISRVGN